MSTLDQLAAEYADIYRTSILDKLSAPQRHDLLAAAFLEDLDAWPEMPPDQTAYDLLRAELAQLILLHGHQHDNEESMDAYCMQRTAVVDLIEYYARQHAHANAQEALARAWMCLTTDGE
jgi:hypothetical protein